VRHGLPALSIGVLLGLLLGVADMCPASAQDRWVPTVVEQPRRAPYDYTGLQFDSAAMDTTGFALVLGGGGARGLAHVGVLRAFEEWGIKPSLVTGTSMGAILGALYACGVDASTLDRMVTGRPWRDLFLDNRRRPGRIQGGWGGLPPHNLTLRLDRFPPSPPTGASYGQAVEALVGELCADALFAADSHFDRLPIPFRCVTTDVLTANPVVFDRGVLPRIVRASGSLPLIFVPVHYEGLTLMDGGFVDNLPVDLARRFGFRRVVVVDVSNIFLPQTAPPEGLFATFRRSTQLTQRGSNFVLPGEQEVLMKVDLAEHTSLSFWSAATIVRKGYEAAQAHKEQILALATAPAAQNPVSRPHVGPVHIRSVDVKGNERLSGWSVRKRLGVFPGDRIELEELWDRVELLAKQSIFHNVWLDIDRVEPEVADVTVYVIERWRPELELGAHYVSDDGAGFFARLRLDNAFGTGGGRALTWRAGEQWWAALADLSQPIRGSRHVGNLFHGGYTRERLEEYRDGREEDAWVFARLGGGLDLEIGSTRWPFTLKAGLRAEDVETYVESRDPAASSDLRLRGFAVELETGVPGGLAPRPRRGVVARYLRAADVMDANVEFWRFEAGLVAERRLGEFLGVNARAGFGTGSPHTPPAWMSRAGGPWTWIGLHRDEQIGSHLAWQRVGVEYRFTPDLLLEIAGAVGWAGRGGFEGRRARFGGGAQFILDTAAGPLRLGVHTSQRGAPMATVQVGYEF